MRPTTVLARDAGFHAFRYDPVAQQATLVLDLRPSIPEELHITAEGIFRIIVTSNVPTVLGHENRCEVISVNFLRPADLPEEFRVASPFLLYRLPIDEHTVGVSDSGLDDTEIYRLFVSSTFLTVDLLALDVRWTKTDLA